MSSGKHVARLGVAGDASGMLLTKMICAEADCADAVRACADLFRCDTVELQFPKSKHRLRRRVHPHELLATAKLRASWDTWGSHVPTLGKEVERCKLLSAEARSVAPGQWLSQPRRMTWQQSFCDEYCASSGTALPDFGRELRPEEAVAPLLLKHCPAPGTKLLLITYQNGPSPWLCTFLRTLGYRDVGITVLGWQPHEFVRANNVFYFTDRVYTLLRYLLACRLSMSDETNIMFCDADEMFQLAAPAAELAAQAEALLQQTRSRVVISAEARCMPNRLGESSWCRCHGGATRTPQRPHALPPPLRRPTIARAHSHGRRPNPLDASRGARRFHSGGFGMPRKWPRCLNTGNFVGRVGPTIDLLNRTCIPCRQGWTVEGIHRRYTRAYSSQVREAPRAHAHGTTRRARPMRAATPPMARVQTHEPL